MYAIDLHTSDTSSIGLMAFMGQGYSKRRG